MCHHDRISRRRTFLIARLPRSCRLRQPLRVYASLDTTTLARCLTAFTGVGVCQRASALFAPCRLLRMRIMWRLASPASRTHDTLANLRILCFASFLGIPPWSCSSSVPTPSPLRMRVSSISSYSSPPRRTPLLFSPTAPTASPRHASLPSPRPSIPLLCHTSMLILLLPLTDAEGDDRDKDAQNAATTDARQR
ncbi:hypothetical protein C8J57DRAFT_1730512 [Mycena rebaudengoi]|nr:hypothetical protein C8J57DRAFT_1730512 [Mycena rebaudengoi]